MDKIRVIHLARRSAPDIGGVESHLAYLIPELDKLGYHSRILNERQLLRHKSWIPAHKIAIWLGLLLHLPTLWRASLIQVHDVFWWLIPFLPILWWKRIFITFHGYESAAGPTWKQKFWHRLASTLTRGNLCIGQFHQTWYQVKANVVAYGAVTPFVPIKKKIKSKGVAFIGRLAPDTGFRSYVQAVGIANKLGIKIKLDVYGAGSELKWAQSYCKHHHLSINFLGFVPEAGAQIGKYSLVFASQYLTILESISAGVPVVAYASSKFKRDYLSDTPFSQWITITTTPAQIVLACTQDLRLPATASIWIGKQTWEKLARQYKKLWGSK